MGGHLNMSFEDMDVSFIQWRCLGVHKHGMAETDVGNQLADAPSRNAPPTLVDRRPREASSHGGGKFSQETTQLKR